MPSISSPARVASTRLRGSDAGAGRRDAAVGGPGAVPPDGMRAPPRALSSGRAAAIFARMVAALGGPADFVEKPESISAAGADRVGRCTAPASRLRHRHRHARHRPCRGWRSAAGARGPTTRSITRSASPGCCRSVRKSSAASRWPSSMRRSEADAEAAAAAVLSAYAIGDFEAGAGKRHPADPAARLMHATGRAAACRSATWIFGEPLEEAHADQIGVSALSSSTMAWTSST